MKLSRRGHSGRSRPPGSLGRSAKPRWLAPPSSVSQRRRGESTMTRLSM